MHHQRNTDWRRSNGPAEGFVPKIKKNGYHLGSGMILTHIVEKWTGSLQKNTGTEIIQNVLIYFDEITILVTSWNFYHQGDSVWCYHPLSYWSSIRNSEPESRNVEIWTWFYFCRTSIAVCIIVNMPCWFSSSFSRYCASNITQHCSCIYKSWFSRFKV